MKALKARDHRALGATTASILSPLATLPRGCGRPRGMKKFTMYVLAAAAIAGATWSLPATAGSLYWASDAACDNGSWDTTTVCWSAASGGSATSGAPVTGDDAYLTESDAVNRTVTYNDTYTSPGLNSLTIDATGTGTMTFQQSANSLAAFNETIGKAGTGTFTQSGGTNTVSGGGLVLGVNTGSTGNYTLSNGTLNFGNSNYNIGFNGTGTFIQSGGTNTVGSGGMILGVETGSIGNYTLSGGTLTVGSSLSAAYEGIGDLGAGTFTQSGGTNTMVGSSGMELGAGTGSSGNYTLSGGTLNVGVGGITTGTGTSSLIIDGGTLSVGGGNGSINVTNFTVGDAGGTGNYTLSGSGTLIAGYEYVGAIGTGIFTQNGGTNAATNKLEVADSGNGSYALSAGGLTTGWEVVGNGGNGIFTQSGSSTNTVGSNGLTVGENGGTGNFALSGGILSAPVELIGFVTNGTGTFTQIGGTNTVGGSGLILGDDSSSTGTYNLSNAGSSLTAATEIIGSAGTGTFTQSGGTNTVGGAVYLGTNSGSNGTYTLSGGTLIVGGNINPVAGGGASTLTIDGGGLNVGGGSIDSGTGSITVANFTVGDTGGTGSFQLGVTGSEAASLTAKYETVGSGGTGTFTQSGGSNKVNVSLYLGANTGSTGSYTLSGGGLSSGTEYIGNPGTGIFTQSGGTNTLSNGTLYLGDVSNSNGTYILSNTGSLSAPFEWIGNNGTGTFTQTGGTNTVTTTLRLASALSSQGQYTLSGGSLTVGLLINSGSGTSSLTIDGGALRVDGGTPGSGSGSIAVGTFTVGDAGGAGYFNLGGTGGEAGSLTANVINNNTNGSFTQSGGTETGTFNNYGYFSYFGNGIFNGQLNNYGTFYPSSSFTAQGGILNGASVTVNSGIGVYANGTGLINDGNITLSGGAVGGSEPLVNNAMITGYGTLGSVGAFTNNGVVNVETPASLYGGGAPTSGMMTLGTGGTNFGNINLIAGSELTLVSGVTLDNHGTLSLAGGILGGSGSLINDTGGTVSGPGTLNGTVTNPAGVLLVQNGTLDVVNGFTNGGVVELAGLSANLAGGALTNTGMVQGNGNVGNAITNYGTIEALGGTLTLGGAVTNEATGLTRPAGLMTASSGSDLLVSGGLATNGGVINLTGGTFDNNNHPLDNTGQISGYGTIRTSELTNDGSMTITGGTTTVNGNLTNSAGHQVTVAYNPAIFTGNVTNDGTFKATSTTVTFAGGFTDNGAYISDPATTSVTNLTVGPTGYLAGGVSDLWLVSGNFINNSTQNTLWNTSLSTLGFTSSTGDLFDLAGKNVGAIAAGYTNNFAWGTLDLTRMTGALTLGTGNGSFTDALYVNSLLGALISGTGITNIAGDGLNLYYLASNAANAYLGDKTYGLGGGGELIPVSAVPLPAAFWLFGSGLLGLAGMARRQKPRPAREWKRAAAA